MTNLIDRITAAQIRQEGAPITAHNPGNIRTPVWRPKPWPMMGGFWFPVTRQEGIAGLQHVIALHIAEGDSLSMYITHYAPPSDGNDTAAYIRNVATWAQIPDIFTNMWVFVDGIPTTGLTNMTMDEQIAEWKRQQPTTTAGK